MSRQGLADAGVHDRSPAQAHHLAIRKQLEGGRLLKRAEMSLSLVGKNLADGFPHHFLNPGIHIDKCSSEQPGQLSADRGLPRSWSPDEHNGH